MNSNKLAKGIVHWLEYETLCNRQKLLNEASLKQPIAQILFALTDYTLAAEELYPALYQKKSAGRKKAIDFALYGPSQNGTQKVFYHVLETKFVNAKRNFKNEVFDDLYRLAWFEPSREPERLKRWFVIAGIWKNVKEHMLDLKIEIDNFGRTSKAFRGILPRHPTSPRCVVRIHNSSPKRKELWCSAANAFDQNEIPETIIVRLAAKTPASPRNTSFCCFIWEISRPANWLVQPA